MKIILIFLAVFLGPFVLTCIWMFIVLARDAHYEKRRRQYMAAAATEPGTYYLHEDHRSLNNLFQQQCMVTAQENERTLLMHRSMEEEARRSMTSAANACQMAEHAAFSASAQCDFSSYVPDTFSGFNNF